MAIKCAILILLASTVRIFHGVMIDHGYIIANIGTVKMDLYLNLS